MTDMRNDAQKAACIERKISEVPDRVERNTGEVITGYFVCERCGKYTSETRVLPVRTRTCECAAKARSARAAIERIDLSGEMTFGALRDPDPSVAAATVALREIAAGTRRRGAMMFGLPGRGKTTSRWPRRRARSRPGWWSGSTPWPSSSRAYSTPTVTRILPRPRARSSIRWPNTMSGSSTTSVRREFVSRYDGAVLSRLGGMCEKLVVRGENRRIKQWEW